MEILSDIGATLAQNWPYWLVSIVLVVAAVIDGTQLRVPNWLTFPMILAGWLYSGAAGGWEGLGWSLLGTVVGLGLLLPAYAIGGMGAGDVKLLAGIGAWVYPSHTVYAFSVVVAVGIVLAVAMVLVRRAWKKHQDQFLMIISEIATIRNPVQLSAMAAERKRSMLLLPYGIPIAIGTIGYFGWMGMLL